MSLFGTTSGFGTSGTSMFGSTTTDNHNPMKVLHRASRHRSRAQARVPTAGSLCGVNARKVQPFLKHWSTGTVCPLDWGPAPPTVPITRVTRGPAHTVESASLRGGRASGSCDQHLGKRESVGLILSGNIVVLISPLVSFLSLFLSKVRQV